MAIVAVLVYVGGSVRAADDDEKVKKLVSVLTDQDKSTQSKEAALKSLGALGKKAEAAIPEIKKAVADRDLAYAAIQSLGQIGKSAVPALVEVLETPPPYKVPLPKIPSKAGPKEQAAADKLFEHDLMCKQYAVEALTSIRGDAANVMKALIAFNINSPYNACTLRGADKLRHDVFMAISTVATDDTAKDAALHYAGYLRSNVSVGGSWEGAYAVLGLQKLGARSKAAVPLIVKAMEAYLKKEKNAPGKVQILDLIDVLKAVGPDAEEALPMLRALLNGPDKLDFESCEKAIEAIKKKK